MIRSPLLGDPIVLLLVLQLYADEALSKYDCLACEVAESTLSEHIHHRGSVLGVAVTIKKA